MIIMDKWDMDIASGDEHHLEGWTLEYLLSGLDKLL